ncbi:heterokaryon incompatibility protein-domain-containing protein [Parachaetomium inaequale]|uniref:Heterokaryon incompatibility protein-domain-containing protein n=1 Tax=Parachaetomium inaequale TaxID=2588326 RepID=A0AAN6PFT3_9PEZI|nr:heterokaryon incompatibility protein-domain-containing protein [Parachaetomium inaequale]
MSAGIRKRPENGEGEQQTAYDSPTAPCRICGHLKLRESTWPWQGTLPHADVLPRHTSDDTAWSKILQWISACEQSHTCYQGVSVLPTRVLDVAGGAVRVHTPGAGDEKAARYTCLSHCWAGHAKFDLTTSNGADLAVDINWDVLPATYQEAITLTRRLGIRYIWIDSLCIVQDDKEDWQRESATMADVYANAYLTIGADLYSTTTSGDTKPTDGCFSAVAPAHVGCVLELPHPASPHDTTYSVSVRKTLHHLPGPLGTRGWIMQERWLSPRCLWCCNNDLIFECCEDSSCLCGSASVNWVWGGATLPTPRAIHFPGKGAEFWREIVATYSPMQLTYPSDRFPAISGIVSSLSKTRKTDYLAGLWRDSLLSDLMWRTCPDDGRGLGLRPTEWIAPTWSWASTSGPGYAYTESAHKRTHGRILTAECNPVAAGNPFGQIAAASLVLSSKFVNARLVYEPDSMGENECPSTLRFDHAVINTLLVRQEVALDYNIWMDKAHHVPPGHPVALLILPSHRYSSLYGVGMGSMCEGIVVVLRTTDTKMAAAVYERIAYCSIELGPDVAEGPKGGDGKGSCLITAKKQGRETYQLDDYYRLGSWYEVLPEAVFSLV